MRNKCSKLYDKTSQVGQLAHVAYASEEYVPLGVRIVLMPDEEFKNISDVPVVSDYTDHRLHLLLPLHSQVTILCFSLPELLMLGSLTLELLIT